MKIKVNPDRVYNLCFKYIEALESMLDQAENKYAVYKVTSDKYDTILNEWREKYQEYMKLLGKEQDRIDKYQKQLDLWYSTKDKFLGPKHQHPGDPDAKWIRKYYGTYEACLMPETAYHYPRKPFEPLSKHDFVGLIKDQIIAANRHLAFANMSTEPYEVADVDAIMYHSIENGILIHYWQEHINKLPSEYVP